MLRLLRGDCRVEHAEFLATETEQDVIRASELLLDCLRELAQSAVARLMAVAIVEGLEVVDVEHAEHERIAAPARRQRFIAQLVEVPPVERARELVGRRELMQAAIRGLELLGAA